MCRNHRGWIDAVVACSKLGANALFLNTAFSGPQLADVAEREKPEGARSTTRSSRTSSRTRAARRKRYIAWHEPDDGKPGDPLLEDLIARGDTATLAAPTEQGKRDHPHLRHDRHAEGRLALACRSRSTRSPRCCRLIPLHAREKTMIAAPLFHAWGFAHWTLGHQPRRRPSCSSASSTRRRRSRSPPSTSATALVVVPVMLQRILELDDEVLDRYDLSTLRACPSRGSALPGALSDRWMDLFGENLYNLYGSTEVAWATIATPRDLREAPGTAGRPPRGTSCSSTTRTASPCRTGETGRIFVGNEVQFEGYTGGGNKDEIDGPALLRRRRPLRRRRAACSSTAATTT